MKCQRCKEREANVQIIQQIAGKKPQTFLFCDLCARELGISMPSFPMNGKITANPFTVMGDVFKSNLGLGTDNSGGKPAYRCSSCKMTFDDFKTSGYMGCTKCYEEFSDQIDPIFCRTQMGKTHIGRKTGFKSATGSDGSKASEDVCDIDLTGGTKGKTSTHSPKQRKTDSQPAEKPVKRKLFDKEADIASDGEASEELQALEKQHLGRLLEKKNKELQIAVSIEDYLKAAKIRDEIADLNKKEKR